MFMAAEEQEETNAVCGFDALDHLCAHPGLGETGIYLEDGDVAHHGLANVPYKHTNSGLKRLKDGKSIQ